ncbi:hypothetical protein F7C95_13875 [Opitutia bacterium ISCC 51]|nr:hypothetical protein F7C95_13875 [Opitutae bacterium ISCC 51]QXD27091.1 hypothetical protein GA003_13790 [Opitutae bacterium ISCC 52]
MTPFLMYLGFVLAAYSVVANDVIQTLGTFLTSNSKRKWWVLWIFAGSIMAVSLIYGWVINDGDVSYARLIGDAEDGFGFDNPKYPVADPFEWWYILPPVVLLVITRLGIPVSTTFLILTFFAPSNLGDMLIKSLSGYGVAFVTALVFYFIVAKAIEKRFLNNSLDDYPDSRKWWTLAQWCSTGFLWSQWLAQDFANIYVYLPRKISALELGVSLVVLLGLLAYIFYQRGGKIQHIVRAKRNTSDIRSATIIDLIFGIVLYYFKEVNSIPMSTTWVFIGMLAGREYALNIRLDSKKLSKKLNKMVVMDLGKVTIGLVASIALVALIHFIKSL